MILKLQQDISTKTVKQIPNFRRSVPGRGQCPRVHRGHQGHALPALVGLDRGVQGGHLQPGDVRGLPVGARPPSQGQRIRALL